MSTTDRQHLLSSQQTQAEPAASSPASTSPEAPASGSTGARGLEPPVGLPPGAGASALRRNTRTPSASQGAPGPIKEPLRQSLDLLDEILAFDPLPTDGRGIPITLEDLRRWRAAFGGSPVSGGSGAVSPHSQTHLTKHCCWNTGIGSVITFCVLPPLAGSRWCQEHQA